VLIIGRIAAAGQAIGFCRLSRAGSGRLPALTHQPLNLTSKSVSWVAGWYSHIAG
jgi:hypothetical protein